MALWGGPKAKAQEDKQQPNLAEVRAVCNLVYSPNGSFLLLQYDARSLGVWDANTGKFRVKMEENSKAFELSK